jgi:hypothetical protein
MTLWRRLVSIVRWMVQRNRTERDLDDELEAFVETLAQTLAETRALAHARMARPVDLDPQFWGLAPTGLFPATGTIATRLEELE